MGGKSHFHAPVGALFYLWHYLSMPHPWVNPLDAIAVCGGGGVVGMWAPINQTFKTAFNLFVWQSPTLRLGEFLSRFYPGTCVKIFTTIIHYWQIKIKCSYSFRKLAVNRISLVIINSQTYKGWIRVDVKELVVLGDQTTTLPQTGRGGGRVWPQLFVKKVQ